jgi:hypothetical protein
MKIVKIMIAGLGLGALGQGFAHHSTNGIYDNTVELELTGVVKEWKFINPHPSLILTVKGEDGVEHDWDISYGGSAVAHLKRRGYSVDTFKAGDQIIVKGHPALVKDAYGMLMEGGNPTHMDGTPFP